MRAIFRQGLAQDTAPVGGLEVLVDKDVAAEFRDQNRPCQAELLADPLAHCRGGERRVHPRCIRDAVESKPLRNSEAAVIGAEHESIVQAAAVEEGEEVAELAVELQELQAHLLPAGTIGVADIVGCRQADREEVRDASAPKLYFLTEAGGEREGGGVDLR